MINYAELVNEQNKKNNALLAKVENFDKVLNKLENCKLSVTDGNLATTYLDDVLQEDQAESIRYSIQSKIEINRQYAIEELEKRLGISKVAETVEVKTEEVKKETSALVPERILHSDFINDYENGMSKQQLATKYDIGDNTVYVYASKLGIKRNKAIKEKAEETTIELNKDLVYSKYTITDDKIEDVAEELGVTKFELHDFIAKNGLRRASKKDQKVFRDTEVQKKKHTPSKVK